MQGIRPFVRVYIRLMHVEGKGLYEQEEVVYMTLSVNTLVLVHCIRKPAIITIKCVGCCGCS